MKALRRTPLAVKAAILVAAASISAVLLIFFLETVTGFALYATRKNAGLLWAPDSIVEHETEEFHYVTRVNNLGFRGDDFSRSKPAGRRRIAVIGDSFTYGWGLSFEETWPKILETTLRQGGRQVEVANLGYPGAGPSDYAALAPRALAVLHPDLLVIGVLQADDLMQASESPGPAEPKWRERLGSRLLQVLPNLSQLAGYAQAKKLHVTAQQLRDIWKKQVADFTSAMTPDERTRYHRLPAHQVELYTQGNLNPGLLYLAMRHPGFMLEACDAGLESTRRGIAQMARRLSAIHAAAASHKVRVVVVTIPYRTYISAAELEDMRQLGFEVDRKMIESNYPDEAVRVAAGRAGLPFVAVTEAFRRQSAGQSFYFHLDGHFNPAGARTYATLLASEITRLLP